MTRKLKPAKLDEIVAAADAATPGQRADEHPRGHRRRGSPARLDRALHTFRSAHDDRHVQDGGDPMTDKLTPDQLDEIEAAAKKATPGEWVHDEFGEVRGSNG